MKAQGHQQGVALIISLVILLLVTLVGMSAIKSGLFHERMAFNTQSEELSFLAAESAIAGVIAEAEVSSSILTSMILTGEMEHCFTRNGGLQDGVCGANDTIDERDSLQSQAKSYFEIRKPLLNTDATAAMDYLFATEGHGAYVDTTMVFNNTNYQQWRKIGPPSGQFSDDAGLLDY